MARTMSGTAATAVLELAARIEEMVAYLSQIGTA